ncbi:hypothetical protein HDU83_007918 [Entophlyctis luteolus]|nr:hypothetical protein HDU83_007918 [Entophlyctis luteolus]KAJ3377574.1 hypothetical protein HDU84_008513 [Entophlyctis sp. JEL0112]
MVGSDDTSVDTIVDGPKLDFADPPSTVSGIDIIASQLSLILARLDALDARIRVIETNTAESSNTKSSNNSNDTKTVDAEPFTSLAHRLEFLAAHTLSQKTQMSDLAARLESITPTVNSNTDSGAAVLALTDRVASLDAKLDRIAANVPPKQSAPTDEIEAKLSLIAQQQVQIQEALKESALPPFSSILDTQENNHLELLHKMAVIESNLEMLPNMYLDSFSNNLQKQTTSLVGIMDGIVKEQTEAIKEAAVIQGKRAYSVLPDLGIAATVKDRVPDLGIAKRFR